MSPDDLEQSSNQPNEPRSPYYDDLWLQNEAHNDPELLDLLVQREQMGDEFKEKGGAAHLDEADRARSLELNKKIRERKETLGIDPYQ
jgi:hypothetical protein